MVGQSRGCIDELAMQLGVLLALLRRQLINVNLAHAEIPFSLWQK
jgi:hypothetical protein